MATTYYYTVNDEIIGEYAIGSSHLDYLTDALGSVVATIDQNLTFQGTARYKPYGAHSNRERTPIPIESGQ